MNSSSWWVPQPGQMGADQGQLGEGTTRDWLATGDWLWERTCVKCLRPGDQCITIVTVHLVDRSKPLLRLLYK